MGFSFLFVVFRICGSARVYRPNYICPSLFKTRRPQKQFPSPVSKPHSMRVVMPKRHPRNYVQRKKIMQNDASEEALESKKDCRLKERRVRHPRPMPEHHWRLRQRKHWLRRSWWQRQRSQWPYQTGSWWSSTWRS